MQTVIFDPAANLQLQELIQSVFLLVLKNHKCNGKKMIHVIFHIDIYCV